MQSVSEIKNIIAHDKNELSEFVLNLCSFTLNEAGYNAKDFGFYLHVAFRHQTILKSAEWESLCEEISKAKNPLTWDMENEALHHRIAEFSQSIVTEVLEANQDSWAIKLLKTSYFSTLDRARKSSDVARQKFEAIQHNDETTKALSQLVEANRTYLDSLLGLPFVMEKFCLSVARNRKVNYQPRKTAEMLAQALDTINSAIENKENRTTTYLIKGLKIALDLSMPDLQIIDGQLLQTINEDLLPYINHIIENSRDLEDKKAAVFPKTDSETASARKELLAAMDVHFYSVKELLQETLLKPIIQVNQAAVNALGLGFAAYNITAIEDDVDRVLYIQGLFKNFDKLASLCSDLDPTLAPSWLNQANSYYQNLKNGLDGVAQIAMNGLGFFYNCYNQLAFFIPQSIRYYISEANSYEKIFHIIDNQAQDIPYDKILAYFAFYELVEQAQFDNEKLKAKFFAVYMAEVVKTSPKLKLEDFNFERYLLLENQLHKKFELQWPLVKNMRLYAEKADPTNSLVMAIEAQGITNPLHLRALVLINRIQTLESKFDSKNPRAVFHELLEAFAEASQSPHRELQAIAQEFLHPAMHRMYRQFQKEFLVPLLEDLLNRAAPYDGNIDQVRMIYSKIQEEHDLTPANLRFLKDYLLEQENDEDEDELIEPSNELSAELINMATLFADNSKPKKEWQTPKEQFKLKAGATVETVKPYINEVLHTLRAGLNEQLERLRPLKGLALAEKKMKYIVAVKGLLSQLIHELEKPQGGFQRAFAISQEVGAEFNKSQIDLQGYLLQLLNGKQASLSPQELLAKYPLNSLPRKLLDFAWSVMVVTPKSTYFYNLLEYVVRDSASLSKLVKAEKEYKDCLNNNPIPALMTELSDPLATVNLIPSQEKIMDAVIFNLIEAGQTTAFTWGVNYLKQYLSTITYESLSKFLPYPFFAELALKAIQSEAIQTLVAPTFNGLMNEYGGKITNEFIRIAKERLYPSLGIVIQKTIEACAYSYAFNPEQSNARDRDSFAMYYLQYRELKQRINSLTDEAAIRFLFPKLLEDVDKEGQSEIINTINQAFAKLDKMVLPQILNRLQPVNAVAEAEDQLHYLIEHINLQEPSYDKLIKLALINRRIVNDIETAQQLTNEQQVSLLQKQAIENLSSTLAVISQQPKQATVDLGLGDSALLVSQDETYAEQMMEALAKCQEQALKSQLELVKSKLAQSKKVVDAELDNLDEMLQTTKSDAEPMLGLSLFEWDYNKSSWPYKIYVAFSKITAILGPISSWSALITAILAGTGYIEILGLTLGATGVGFAICASLSLLMNFAGEIIENVDKIKEFSEENSSFWRKTWNIGLLVTKCFGLALAKTLFIEQIVSAILSFFPKALLIELRDAARFWPKKDRVDDEIEKITSLQIKMDKLGRLIDKQIKFIDPKGNKGSTEVSRDQSEKIGLAIQAISTEMQELELFLKTVSFNDARFARKGYQSVLESFASNFAKLTSELTQLSELNLAKAKLKTVVRAGAEPELLPKDLLASSIILQTSEQAKAVVVNLKAYKDTLLEQPGYLANLWNWMTTKPTPVVPVESQSVDKAPVQEQQADSVAAPLTVSSFFMVESSNSLFDSFIRDIPTSPSENEKGVNHSSVVQDGNVNRYSVWGSSQETTVGSVASSRLLEVF